MKKRMAISLSIFLLLFSACNSSNYEILSFFFDGVPDPNEKKIEIQEVVIDSSGIKKRDAILKRAASKFVFLHDPYKEKLCEDCHNLSRGFELLKKIPELCYECHDDFGEEATFIHGPVAAGYCTECHSPHKSKNEFLLLEAGQNLCFKCHVENDIKRNEEHFDIDDEYCITCHDPHGSNEKYLL